MDFSVSTKTLQHLEDVIYNCNLELLKDVHEKFLSDIDFQELQNILDNKKKKKFIINVKEDNSN